jgi:hypothetical protein
MFLFNTITLTALKRISTMVLTARPNISRNFRRCPTNWRHRDLCGNGPWENLHELRWVLLDSAGMEVAATGKEDADLEGKAD